MRRTLLTWAMATILTLGLAACSPSSIQENATTPPEGSVQESSGTAPQAPPTYDLLLLRAKEDASLEQVAILEAAIEEGYLSLGELQLALERTFACFDQQGIPWIDHGLSNQDGLAMVRYSYGIVTGLTEEQSLAIADRCMDLHISFLESFYIWQPIAREVFDNHMELLREEMIECLEELGQAVDPELTVDEVLNLSLADHAPPGAHRCYFDTVELLPMHEP